VEDHRNSEGNILSRLSSTGLIPFVSFRICCFHTCLITVVDFSLISCQILQGHQGTIMSIAWSDDSIYLSSAGVDGGVHGWFMDGFNRYAECVTTGSLYSSIVYDANRKYVYGCGPNIPLRAVDTDKKYVFPQVLPDEVEDDGLPPEEEEEEHSGSCWEHHIFRFHVLGFMIIGLCAYLEDNAETIVASSSLGYRINKTIRIAAAASSL
jgi:WD40 repeat protein